MQVAYKLNLPLILTLIRLVIAPVILPLSVYYLYPSNSFAVHFALAVMCAFFCLTDFFDGYLARKYSQVTTLGQLLDPIADKFFICATLVALVAIHKVYFFWVIVLLGRELFMNGLRMYAATQAINVPVNILGKLKTTFQGIFLFVVILNPYRWISETSALLWHSLEMSLLLVTVVCSVYSAFRYARQTFSILLAI